MRIESSTVNEIWRPVVGHESTHEVSNMGRVRSIDHVDHRGRPWPGKILKPFKCGSRPHQYLKVTIDKKNTAIHRIVCFAFLEKPEGKEHVNHKNGDKLDNRLDNLEWCTPQENRLHAFRVLGIKSSGGHKGKTGSKHHASKEVIAISSCGHAVLVFGSTAEAARHFGIPSGTIPRVCSGKYRHSRGWSFGYI